MLRGVWNLPGPGIEPVSPCIDRRILHHWTPREVLLSLLRKGINHELPGVLEHSRDEIWAQEEWEYK